MKVSKEIQERIVAAAGELVAEGNQEPTNDQIREKMGRGSLSHISPVMREWRKSRNDSALTAQTMPEGLQAVTRVAMAQIWTVANKRATEDAQAIKERAEAQVVDVEQERDEALTEIQKLEAKVKTSQDGAERAQEESRTLAAEKSELHAELAKGDAERSGLIARISDRDQQISELKDDLGILKNEMKSLQSELIKIAKSSSNNK
jgi:chromosome segregation ATPase